MIIYKFKIGDYVQGDKNNLNLNGFVVGVVTNIISKNQYFLIYSEQKHRNSVIFNREKAYYTKRKNDWYVDFTSYPMNNRLCWWAESNELIKINYNSQWSVAFQYYVNNNLQYKIFLIEELNLIKAFNIIQAQYKSDYMNFVMLNDSNIYSSAHKNCAWNCLYSNYPLVTYLVDGLGLPPYFNLNEIKKHPVVYTLRFINRK